MIERNPLDFFGVLTPNERDFPTKPSASGRFTDDLSFNPRTLLPRDGRSWRPEFGGSSRAAPAIFSQFEYPRLALVVPREGLRLQELPNLQSVGLAKLAGPMQSGEECCKKSIGTVVVVVALRREWF